jgi:putative inorganic carbon (hco3(-)) transporter
VIARTLGWQRVIVAVAVVGGALAVYPQNGDIFALPKATVVWLCGLAAVGVVVGRAIYRRRILVPRTPAVLAALAFGAGMVLTTLTSTTPMQSLVGQYSRFAGLGTYAACIVLLVSVVQAHDETTLPRFVQAVVVAAAAVTLLGLLQWTGDTFDWDFQAQVISTMGNPNFLAGWVGLAFPLCAGLALAYEHVAWRILGGLTALAIVPVAFATDSFQGPATVAVAGVAFVLLLAVTGGLPVPGPLRTKAGILAVVAVVLLGGAVATKVLWPGIDDGLLERRHFWSTAVEVFTDHPVVGTGPETFHNQFLPRRSAEHAAIPASKNAGAAHDIPLQMAADGGLALLVPYLAFVLLVGWRLVVAVRRRVAPPWLVAGVGAAWIGYQTQSLVSIDQPQLAVAHWVLAGAVIVLAGPLPSWSIPLPGAKAERGEHAPIGTVVGVGIASVLTLVAAWFAIRPMRADLHVIAGVEARQAGDAATAFEELRAGRDLAPWESKYTSEMVQLATQGSAGDLALEESAEGVRLEPGDSSYAVIAAFVAEGTGDHELAERYFDRALEIDPYGLNPLTNAARNAAGAGERERTEELVDRILAVTDDRADGWADVGLIWSRLGDEEEARAAFQRALDIDPAQEKAVGGLEELDR